MAADVASDITIACRRRVLLVFSYNRCSTTICAGTSLAAF